MHIRDLEWDSLRRRASNRHHKAAPFSQVRYCRSICHLVFGPVRGLGLDDGYGLTEVGWHYCFASSTVNSDLQLNPIIGRVYDTDGRPDLTRDESTDVLRLTFHQRSSDGDTGFRLQWVAWCFLMINSSHSAGIVSTGQPRHGRPKRSCLRNNAVSTANLPQIVLSYLGERGSMWGR